MVKLDGKPGNAFTIRVAGKFPLSDAACSNANDAYKRLANVAPQVISGYAVLQYESYDKPLNPTPFAKPADGYPSLPTSTPYMDYSSVMLNNATEFNFGAPNAAPFIALPPPSNDEVHQTIFLDMSRPNATMWAANGTGLHHSLYEEIDPLIWKDVWQSVEEAIDENEGSFVGSPLIMADSIAVVPELGSVVDLIFVVAAGQ